MRAQLRYYSSMGTFNNWVERSCGESLTMWVREEGEQGSVWHVRALKDGSDADSQWKMPSTEMLVDFMLQVRAQRACNATRVCMSRTRRGRVETSVCVHCACVHMLRGVQMAHGDGLVVKGGDPSYYATERFAESSASTRTKWMTAEKKQEFGWGAYASEPYSYNTIDLTVTAISWFYDQVCAQTCGERQWMLPRNDLVRVRCACAYVRAAHL